MAYFKYFPVITYDVRGKKNQFQIDVITNILVRVRKKLDLTMLSYFDEYFLQDGDTPESLAHQVYNDSQLHWVILYTNYMTNPYYDWPLTYFDLKKFVDKKYSNINAIHHYEDADGYEVDSTAAGATSVTNFIHEETLNDAKRNLTVIRPEYVNNVVNEFKKLLK